ncbi:MAG: transposase [Acidobacteriota bacterium]
MAVSPPLYRPRQPEKTAFYRCLEDYWPEFKQSYPYFYEADYGPLRPVVEKTVERFLACGIYRHGFARVRCGRCAQEYLLAFSCKTRYFCPSCQAKRVAAFVQWVTQEVLEPVPHRQLVWTIPKVLRPAFRKDRTLLGHLSRCAWRSLRRYFQLTLDKEALPGVILAIQTYGDQLNHHPHAHSLVSEGAWRKEGSFMSVGEFDQPVLTSLFQHQVLGMLVRERRLSTDFAEKLRTWRHSGFQVYCGRPVQPEDRASIQRLAAYILRPSFAATQVVYDQSSGQVQYQSAKGITCSMDALDWIALVTSHIPDPGEHMVRYYAFYSNVARGKRRLGRDSSEAATPPSESAGQDCAAEAFSKARRASWARLLRQIYEVDPLTCADCGGRMEIIAFIDQPQTIRKILEHLNLWATPPRAPPTPLFAHKLEEFLASLTPEQARRAQVSTDSIFWDDVPTYTRVSVLQLRHLYLTHFLPFFMPTHPYSV